MGTLAHRDLVSHSIPRFILFTPDRLSIRPLTLALLPALKQSYGLLAQSPVRLLNSV
jgi:hypothetical protein